MAPLYNTIPIRPDDCRDDWSRYVDWVNTLTPTARALWEEWGNDDDGPWTQLIPGTIRQGDRIVGESVAAGMSPEQIQELFEWWHERNPNHNRDFYTNLRPVANPVYSVGQPKERFPNGSIDYRYEVNNFLVSRSNPSFWKFGMLYSGNRSDKPPYPAPEHWIKRPGMGGAFDRGFKSLSFKPW